MKYLKMLKTVVVLTLVLTTIIPIKKESKATEHNGKQINIIMFGDSLTAGYGLDSKKQALPTILENNLTNLGIDVKINNSGVSGDTTATGLSRLKFTLANTNFDIMLLALGGNDVLRGIKLTNTENNLQAIINYASNLGLKVILLGMQAPPNLGKEYSSQIITIFKDLATKNKLELYPFILDGVAAQQEYNQPDGIHPNAAGVRIIAKKLSSFLEPMLRNK